MLFKKAVLGFIAGFAITYALGSTPAALLLCLLAGVIIGIM